MITKAGHVIFGSTPINPGARVTITGFTFEAGTDAMEQIGEWLFDNFQDDFKMMGLELVKIAKKRRKHRLRRPTKVPTWKEE